MEKPQLTFLVSILAPAEPRFHIFQRWFREDSNGDSYTYSIAHPWIFGDDIGDKNLTKGRYIDFQVSEEGDAGDRRIVVFEPGTDNVPVNATVRDWFDGTLLLHLNVKQSHLQYRP